MKRLLTLCGFACPWLVLVAAHASAMPLGFTSDGAEISVSNYDEFFQEGPVDFTAIVKLSNCSGSLVRFTTSLPTDNAVVLTNGHCLEGQEMLEPGEVVVDLRSSRRFTLLTSNGTSSLATLTAAKILYGTMTDTDAAFYQLSTTYASIESKFGVQALTIADQHPSESTPIRIVSGYWRKIYACEIDAFVHVLREGGWTFKDSVRFSEPGCETIGGTSGSPVINADTKEVIAINNTNNESGQRCTINNPCEVDPNGTVVVRRNRAYGQQVYKIYGCLGDGNRIDLSQTGCDLPRPTLH